MDEKLTVNTKFLGEGSRMKADLRNRRVKIWMGLDSFSRLGRSTWPIHRESPPYRASLLCESPSLPVSIRSGTRTSRYDFFMVSFG